MFQCPVKLFNCLLLAAYAVMQYSMLHSTGSAVSNLTECINTSSLVFMLTLQPLLSCLTLISCLLL